MLYVVLRGRWKLIPQKTKKLIIWQFCSDFTTKKGREYIFKRIIWNESLHKISNGDGITVVNYATFKNLKITINYSYQTDHWNVNHIIKTTDPLSVE
jgi:hypothetical protein